MGQGERAQDCGNVTPVPGPRKRKAAAAERQEILGRLEAEYQDLFTSTGEIVAEAYKWAQLSAVDIEYLAGAALIAGARWSELSNAPMYENPAAFYALAMAALVRSLRTRDEEQITATLNSYSELGLGSCEDP